MVRTEKYIYIPRLTDGGLPAHSEQIDGLYLGNEFCYFLIPEEERIREGLALCGNAGISFALVLPWCPQPALKAARSALSVLPEGTEVVFNDWGLLRMIREFGLKPTAGRLLSPHCADPRAMAIRQLGDAGLDRWMSDPPAGTKDLHALMREHGVNRVEFDNTAQGVTGRAGGGLKGSLYYPYVYITTGRMCMTRFLLTGRFTPDTSSCSAPCRDILIRRKILSVDRDVYLKGNSHFYISQRLPEDRTLARAGIDRLVFMPGFPF